MTNKEYISTKEGTVHFMNNELFIAWRICPTEELDKYWENFIVENPHLAQTLQNEIDEFDLLLSQTQTSLQINKAKQEVREKLASSIKSYNAKRSYKNYLAIASVILIFVTSTLLYLDFASRKTEITIGNIADNNEIQLYQGDNIVQINNNSAIDFSNLSSKAIIKDSLSQREIALNDKQLHRLVVPYGKRSSVVLPDGSKVWLNSGSEIEFYSVFDENTRDITMKGEIYLDVAHDKNKKFIVHTPSSQIAVLGTIFNVSAYESESVESVVLVEGKVEVQNNKKSVVMTPNQMTIIENGQMVSKVVNTSEYTSWINGYLEFTNTPLPQVLKAISRYYNVEFRYASNINIEDQTCSGKLFLSDSVEDMLDIIRGMTQLEYVQVKETINITLK